jgi:hypothetical protein
LSHHILTAITRRSSSRLRSIPEIRSVYENQAPVVEQDEAQEVSGTAAIAHRRSIQPSPVPAVEQAVEHWLYAGQ